MKLGWNKLQVKDIDGVVTWLRDLITRATVAVDNSHLGFGDGTTADNIYGVWVTYVSNGVANTEDAVTHNLGVTPIGYLVFSVDKGAVIYKGTTTWTSATIYLKSTVATTTSLIFVIGPSNQAFLG